MTNNSRLSILSIRNFKWLVLCCFLGIGVFLLWSGLSFQETDIFIMVDFGKIPSGLTITGTPLKGIEARVRGPRSAIKALSDLKLQYVLDLSGIDVGIKSVPIKSNRIPLPHGISIIKINPDFLTVKVENEIRKKLPVIVAFSGKPATGFTVSSAFAKPLSVTLRGPENALNPMEEVLTKPIDIKGLSESFKKEIALDLSENIKSVAHSGIVLAEIFIKEKIGTKKITDIFVQGKDTEYVYSIKPTAIEIEVKGPVNIVEKLIKDKGVEVYVDLKGLKPGIYIRRATITLPVKTTLISVKPEIFTVTIQRNRK